MYKETDLKLHLLAMQTQQSMYILQTQIHYQSMIKCLKKYKNRIKCIFIELTAFLVFTICKNVLNTCSLKLINYMYVLCAVSK